ncbi:pyruvate, water dikinase [Desulfopila sp. IMCC35006]|uniref:PEP/pyruvate-binding domain-containing protein n=1 Tax=Desulfopila sp. IMCC35006 TaxID=2569542 RepID=UPI0010ABDDB3|nr:PEP/pyruvate-binding domain-containing protein [Desulfopila sp. IMCC35006]TKB28532.1 pyruvate, water dikinase [Desulfopila sp. IMCC35006]
MYNVIKKLLTFPRRRKEVLPFTVLFKKFQDILENNNLILELMADMGDKLGGEYVFDRRYIEEAAEKVGDHVFKLISGLSILTQRKNVELFVAFERIRQAIQGELSGRHFLPSGNLVLPLGELSSEMSEQVGDKMAKLGDIHNRLALTTPDGFVITTQAFFEFMKQKGLLEKAEQAALHWDAGDDAAFEQVADAMQKSILSTPVPRHLSAQIFAQFDALAERMQRSQLALSIRSSGWGEGEDTSFAGQYASLLNASPDQLIDGYRQVVASAYSFKAWSYRLNKGYQEHETAMAVGCQVMVESAVSGVLHTYAPDTAEGAMVANALWGLCAPVVEGNRRTDTIIIDRTPPYVIRSSNVVEKPQRLVAAPGGGVAWEDNPVELHAVPSLSKEQLQELSQTAMRIERYYKRPQEIEWTFDSSGQLQILQTRALRFRKTHAAPKPQVLEAVRDAEIIFSDKGFVVQRGVGIGKIFMVESDADLKVFPYGAIMLVRYTSPRYSSIMHKARGIITDVGSPTGHMASLAREYRVPTIVDTEVATSLLQTGDEVTLDATQNIVYRGNISALDRFELTEDEVFEDFYEYRLLRRLLKHISPLNLLDAQNENFTPAACRTFHDITRYIHEKAVEELIHLSEKKGAQHLSAPKKLIADIPLGLMVIDAGGGTSCPPDARVVTPDQIVSLPLRDFLSGLNESGMWCTKPVDVDLGSFMASLTRTFPSSMASPKEIGRNLAVVLENYMNINMRLGYHFTIIDAYISDTINDNSIYFRFLGGVTEFIRRSRRAKFIAQVLTHFDFRVEVHGDLVIGRVKKLSRSRMTERIRILGGLVGYTRQLDTQMHSDKDVAMHVQQFLDVVHHVIGGV